MSSSSFYPSLFSSSLSHYGCFALILSLSSISLYLCFFFSAWSPRIQRGGEEEGAAQMAAEWTKQFLPEENGNENDGGGGGEKKFAVGFLAFCKYYSWRYLKRMLGNLGCKNFLLCAHFICSPICAMSRRIFCFLKMLCVFLEGHGLSR